MIYDIVFDPHPMLHQRSADVNPADIGTRAFQKLIKDMVETMYVKDGVGLAAVQIGKPIQMCVITKNFSGLNKREDLCLINPVWKKLSNHQKEDDEGCLSVPGIYGKVKRYTEIEVTALNKKGETITFVAKDFFARIVQHEADHLNGHLFIEKAKDLHQVQREL